MKINHLESMIQHEQNQLNEPPDGILSFLMIVMIVLLASSVYAFRNELRQRQQTFPRSPITQTTLDEFNRIINDHKEFFPENLIAQNNIQVGVTTHQELLTILKNQVDKVVVSSKEFRDMLKRTELGKQFLTNEDFYQLKPETVSYAKNTALLWSRTNNDKAIYNPQVLFNSKRHT